MAEEWYTSTRRLRPWTRKGYREVLDRLILPRFGGWKIGAVDTRAIAAYIEELEKSGLSPSSVSNYLMPLNGTLQHAAANGLIPANPCRSLSRNQRPAPRKREAAHEWSDAEIKALLDSAAYLARQPNSRYDYTPILRTAIYTGLRLGELLGLKWGDIDFESGALNVERQFTRSNELAPPKTAKGVRRVPLNAEVVAFLRKHRIASKHSQDGDHVFASRTGGPLLHRNVQRRGFDPAVEHAEIEGVTFHDLRHAFASICAHRGVPVGVVSKVMGHANVAITLSVYTHLFNPDEADEAFRVAMTGSMV